MYSFHHEHLTDHYGRGGTPKNQMSRMSVEIIPILNYGQLSYSMLITERDPP